MNCMKCNKRIWFWFQAFKTSTIPDYIDWTKITKKNKKYIPETDVKIYHKKCSNVYKTLKKYKIF